MLGITSLTSTFGRNIYLGPNDRIQFSSSIKTLPEIDLELENNASLSFHDVLLVRDNNTLTRKIYQKPDKIDSVIPLKASAHLYCKLAAFYSFMKGAYLICSQEYEQDELDDIIQIAIDHSFHFNTLTAK